MLALYKWGRCLEHSDGLRTVAMLFKPYCEQDHADYQRSIVARLGIPQNNSYAVARLYPLACTQDNENNVVKLSNTATENNIVE